MPQNVIRISDFGHLRNRGGAPKSPPQCRAENRDGYRCQGGFGHEGPHHSTAATEVKSDGCWEHDYSGPPPRVA